MDLTKSSKLRYNKLWVNAEAINYLAVSCAAPLLYFILKAILSFFTDSAVRKIIPAVAVAIILYFVYDKFVFIKSRTKPVVRIAGYTAACVFDFAIFYVLTQVVGKELSNGRTLLGAAALFFILIINYLLFSMLIFKSPVAPEERDREKFFRLCLDNRFVILSGLLAAFIMLFVYFCYSAYPFGDMTILRMDLYHQYGPLFGELYDRIANGQSLLYSWTSGGGSAFLGNFFNYLSSPLSFIIFFFERENLTNAISVIILVKAVLSAMSFALYLKLSYKRSSYVTVGFALLYAFCGYFLAYYWNVMWLDALYLLPMVVYGIERIINKRDCRLYLASLCLTMISNYYMAFILCIFSVMYFIIYFFTNYSTSSLYQPCEQASKKEKLKNNVFINSGLIFALSSIAAAAICAVALVPTFIALQSSSATSGTFPQTVSTYFDLFDFIGNHFSALETTIRSSGGDVLPNVYSGIIVIILIPLYIMNTQISTKKKVFNVLTLAFFVISFNTNVLNYIWHAFHFPNDLPYRFSFLYTFVILTMAFDLLMHFKEIKYKDIMLIGMLALLVAALFEKMPTRYVKDNKTIYISIGFIIFYCFVLSLAKMKKPFRRSVVSVLLLLVMSTEIIAASTDSYSISQSFNGFAGDYPQYKQVINMIDKNAPENEFARTEKLNLKARMDPCWYGYNGISAFSSMAYENYSKMQFNLGMYGNRINSYTYNLQTPVYNSMFAMKYFIQGEKDRTPNEEYYRKLFSSTTSNLTVYENKYFLPIAFRVNSSIKDFITNEGDPFFTQNELFKAAAGTNDIFVPADVKSISFENANENFVTSNGNFTFTKLSDDDGSVTLEITALQEGNIYIYAKSSYAEEMEIFAPSETLEYNFKTPYIYDVGYFQEGQSFSVTIKLNDELSGDIDFYAYSADKAEFEKGYEFLSNNAITTKEVTDTKIAGTITAEKDGVLYTSIPYDKGWKVTIDGEEVETYKIADAMLAVDITEGSHTVEFEFMPVGLIPGAIITVISTVGCIAFFVVLNKRKKARSDISQELYDDIETSI